MPFDSWSFFVGMVSGYVVRLSDIIPMFTGLLLGYSIHKFPEYFGLDQVPEMAKLYAASLKHKLETYRDQHKLASDQETPDPVPVPVKPAKPVIKLKNKK